VEDVHVVTGPKDLLVRQMEPKEFDLALLESLSAGGAS
jgi:hypothetical protein